MGLGLGFRGWGLGLEVGDGVRVGVKVGVRSQNDSNPNWQDQIEEKISTY